MEANEKKNIKSMDERQRDLSEFINFFERGIYIFLALCVIFCIGMAAEVWANLPKSQDDPETIEEAISRIIAEHNEDPTAHTGDGEAIDVHRKNDVVDHPEGSVLADKFTNDDIVFQPLFENVTPYTKSAAGVTSGLGGIRLDTGVTSNTVRYLSASGQFAHTYCRDNKRQTFQASVSISNTSNVTAYFGLGAWGLSSWPPGFGFKIQNGNLYASAVRWVDEDAVESTVLITGYTLTAKHFYRVQVTPAEGLAYYYVDSELVATIAIGTNTDYDLIMFEFYVKNTAAGQKILSVSNVYTSFQR